MFVTLPPSLTKDFVPKSNQTNVKVNFSSVNCMTPGKATSGVSSNWKNEIRVEYLLHYPPLQRSSSRNSTNIDLWVNWNKILTLCQPRKIEMYMKIWQNIAISRQNINDTSQMDLWLLPHYRTTHIQPPIDTRYHTGEHPSPRHGRNHTIQHCWKIQITIIKCTKF